MMMATRIAPLLIIFALGGGCASYRQSVSDSFRDTFKANIGIGAGIYAHAKATSFLDAGAGWGGYWVDLGMESRYTPLIHPSINGCLFPLGVIPGLDETALTVLRMATVHDTIRTEGKNDEEYAVAGQLFDKEAIAKWDAYGIEKRSLHKVFHTDTTYTDHPLGLEAGVGLLVIDASVGFDPAEFFNLMAAISGHPRTYDIRLAAGPATKPTE